MTKHNHPSPESRLQKIEQNLSELADAVHDHNRRLDKHSAAMDKLAQDIRQLDDLLKKGPVRNSCQPSMQLREAVKSFVEYQINPYFYQNASTIRIKSGPRIARSALGPGRFSSDVDPSSEQVQ